MRSLIGSVVVTPQQPRPAESVRIEALSPTGEPLEGTGVLVVIDGIPGALRYMQFAEPGERTFTVRATSGPVTETETVVVDVVGEVMRFRMARRSSPPR